MARTVAVMLCAVVVAVIATGRGLLAAPIHVAAQAGDLDEVKSILAKDPKQVKAVDSEKCTPLHLAAQAGKKEVAEYLLSRSADPKAKDNHGRTPLYLAVMKDQKEMVEFLVS